jgi:hypothetical protein
VQARGRVVQRLVGARGLVSRQARRLAGLVSSILGDQVEDPPQRRRAALERLHDLGALREEAFPAQGRQRALDLLLHAAQLTTDGCRVITLVRRRAPRDVLDLRHVEAERRELELGIARRRGFGLEAPDHHDRGGHQQRAAHEHGARPPRENASRSDRRHARWLSAEPCESGRHNPRDDVGSGP